MRLPFFKKKESRNEAAAAIASYREAAEKNPQDPRIHTKLAELLLSSGQRAEAIAAYCAAAKAYETAGKNRIVTAIYQHVLSLDPGKIEVYQWLVDAFMKEYLIGDAVETMVRLATYYYDHDRHYEAAQTIKKITEIDPENKFYKTKVERFLTERNLSPEAVEKIGPADKWTLVQHEAPAPEPAPAGVHVDLERILDESSINFEPEQILEAEADGAVQGTPRSVLEQISSIVGTDAAQDTPDFHYNLGLAFMQSGEYEPACDEFTKATDSSAHRADAYRCLIVCCRQLGRYEDAEKAADAALKLKDLSDGDRLALLFEQALVSKSRGDRKRALAIFKKIYEQDKNFKSVMREIKELS